MRKIGLCGIAVLVAMLVACGGGSSTPPPPPPPTPTLVSIDLTPTGPGIVVGDVEQFTATGHFDDGSTQDITSSAAWTTSDNAIATINSAGQATGVAVGAVTVTVTQSSINNSTALNVVAAQGPTLNGRYAFTLQGADTRGNQFFAGSFSADGNGNISGVVDANTGSGVQTNVAVAGTYTMFSDGRGEITLTSPSTVTLRFILSAGGAAGKLIEFDGAGTLKGTFKQQPGADALEVGTYVFVLGGMDATSGSVGQVGAFDTDSVTGITGGVLDADDAGTITIAAAITADPNAYTDPDANGRGTLKITTAAGAANYVYYAIDSDHLNLIQVDASPNTALGGVAELQSGVNSDNTDLNGHYALLMDHPSIQGATRASDRGEFNKIGQFVADGNGSITSGKQDEDNGTQNPVTVQSTSKYNISGARARGSLTVDLSDLTSETSIFYMVSPSKLFLLQTLNGAKPYPTPPVGVAEITDAGGFSNNTLSGSYALDASELTEDYSEILMQLQFDGAGNASGIADSSVDGVVSSTPVTFLYTTPVNTNTGRGLIGSQDAGKTYNYVLYLVSPSKAWILGDKGPNLDGPDSDGSIEVQ